MSFRLKRIKQRTSRSSRASKKDQVRPVLITFGQGSCDCPICREMGIDLDASGGIDARPIEDVDQLEKVMALIEAAKTSSAN